VADGPAAGRRSRARRVPPRQRRDVLGDDELVIRGQQYPLSHAHAALQVRGVRLKSRRGGNLMNRSRRAGLMALGCAAVLVSGCGTLTWVSSTMNRPETDVLGSSEHD